MIIIIDCCDIFNILIDDITCCEINFMGDLKSLKEFNKDESIIYINERMERYVNGLISLKSPVITIYNDITFMSQDQEVSRSSFLWENVSSLNSSLSYEVIAHYVVTRLGKYLGMNEKQLNRDFAEWKPGKTKDPIEKEIFSMYKSSPVDYWLNMKNIERWNNLAQIALRIIPIPPTEAACERVFSARRDIMKNHTSKIRDSVVEARANFKSGLYQQDEE